MKKLFGVFLMVCLLATVVPFASFASEGDPVLTIKAYNVSFKESVYLKYAVSAENTVTLSLLFPTGAVSTSQASCQPDNTACSQKLPPRTPTTVDLELTSSRSRPSTRSSQEATVPSPSSASDLAGLKVLEMKIRSFRFC